MELLRQEPKISPGLVLGFLERILFFIALRSNSWLIVGGWLTFKLGSKWEIYKSVIFLPQKMEGMSDLDYLVARRALGAEQLMTYLVGNIANILTAITWVWFGRHGIDLFLSIYHLLYPETLCAYL